MNELQRPWPDVAAELNQKLKSIPFAPIELSKACNISYYAAYRLFVNGAKNRTENAQKVCDHFEIALNKPQEAQNHLMTMLTETLSESWDGSEPHAELIARLLKSTKSFKVEDRK